MTQQPTIDREDGTIKTKENISLFIALAYLDGLYCNATDLLQDKEYNRLFHELYDCVNEKIELSYGEVIDIYTVIESKKK